MVDVAKKVRKASDKLLEDGEEVRAACVTRPSREPQPSAPRDEAVAADTDLAAGFPEGNLILAVTDRRVAAFRQGTLSGKPTEEAASWPLHAIVSVTADDGKLVRPLTITFSDGSQVQVEGMAATSPEVFVAALS